MAKIINFQNVEKLVFFDSKLRKLLPDFKNLFHSWGLAQEAMIRPIAQKTTIEFLNQLKENHIKILSEYFNEEVKVEKIDSNIVKHIDTTINDAEQLLNSQVILKEMVFAYREDEQLYISLWR